MAAFVANGLFLFWRSCEVMGGWYLFGWLTEKGSYDMLWLRPFIAKTSLWHILCYNADIWQHCSTVRNIDSFQCIPSTYFFKKNIYEMFKHLLFLLLLYYYVGKKVTRLMLTLTMYHLAWSFSPFFPNLPLFAYYSFFIPPWPHKTSKKGRGHLQKKLPSHTRIDKHKVWSNFYWIDTQCTVVE